MLVTAVKP